MRRRSAPFTVEVRELRALAEAREDVLEAVELPLGRIELPLGAVRIDEELDLGAHRVEAPLLHHDVLVIVSGGRLTIRTAGLAGATPAGATEATAVEDMTCRCLAAAIAVFLWASCTLYTA